MQLWGGKLNWTSEIWIIKHLINGVETSDSWCKQALKLLWCLLVTLIKILCGGVLFDSFLNALFWFAMWIKSSESELNLICGSDHKTPTRFVPVILCSSGFSLFGSRTKKKKKIFYMIHKWSSWVFFAFTFMSCCVFMAPFPPVSLSH